MQFNDFSARIAEFFHEDSRVLSVKWGRMLNASGGFRELDRES